MKKTYSMPEALEMTDGRSVGELVNTPRPPSFPDFFHERAWIDAGAGRIAGVDEAGRGPLAGPVVAAAVRLDPARIPQGLNDSKKLTPARRAALFERLMAEAEVGVASAPPAEIFALNIRGATLAAMGRAIAALPRPPDRVLIDGRDLPPDLPCPGLALVGGDGRSLSIAAASIVAKVVRDRLCLRMDEEAPQYGFARHKGYGTAAHLRALAEYGPCRHHRAGFAPVAEMLARDPEKYAGLFSLPLSYCTPG